MSWYKTQEEAKVEAAERESERKAAIDLEIHNGGQKAGSQASFAGKIAHDLGGFLFHSKKFNEGFENGKK
jgi:hypothetical protein